MNNDVPLTIGINGVALVTDWLHAGGIWTACYDPVTSSWTACFSAPSTSWSACFTTPSTTWSLVS